MFRTVIFRLTATIALVAALSGCMGAGMARRGARAQTSERTEVATGAQVTTAQEKAISAARGGWPDAPIPWAVAGLQGTMLYDTTVTMTMSCRRYRQSLVLNGQPLNGQLIACPQGDGSWRIVSPQP